MSARTRWGLQVLAGMAAIAAASPALAGAQSLPPLAGFVFDGSVHAIVKGPAGETYVGGNFTGQIKPSGGGLVAAAPSGTGAVVPGAVPAVTGTVVASAEDGAGGLFIGGTFTAVGGVARRNLAHIRANGSVDPVWNPSPDGPVELLDRIDGRLAVAGDFAAVGGRVAPARPYAGDDTLAVLDTATGRATAFTSGAAGSIAALDATTGGRIYLAGYLRFAGTSGPAVALDLATGAALPWRPAVEPRPDAVGSPGGDAIKLVGSTVVLGVVFENLDHLFLGLDPATAATRWQDDTVVQSPTLAKTGSRLYVVSDGFSYFDDGGNGRRVVPIPFALDPVTGKRVWEAAARIGDTSRVRAFVRGGTLYVTGDFMTVGGTRRYRTAAFDTTTGALLPWNPGLGSHTEGTIAELGGRITLGGNFSGAGQPSGSTGWVARIRPDGTLDPSFHPVTVLRPGYSASGFPNTSLDAMAIEGTRLYIAGALSYPEGSYGGNVGAIDLTTGEADPTFVAGPAGAFYNVIRPAGPYVRLGSVQFSGFSELTRTGAYVPDGEDALGRLKTMAGTLTTSTAATFVTPGAGTLRVEARLSNGYVVGTGTTSTTTPGASVTVQLALNDAGRLIRSVYPGFAYATSASYTYAEEVDGPPLTATAP